MPRPLRPRRRRPALRCAACHDAVAPGVSWRRGGGGPAPPGAAPATVSRAQYHACRVTAKLASARHPVHTAALLLALPAFTPDAGRPPRALADARAQAGCEINLAPATGAGGTGVAGKRERHLARRRDSGRSRGSSQADALGGPDPDHMRLIDNTTIRAQACEVREGKRQKCFSGSAILHPGRNLVDQRGDGSRRDTRSGASRMRVARRSSSATTCSAAPTRAAT